MENINQCTICNSSNLQHFLDCQDHFVTGENFKISICADCGFHFTNPRPDRSTTSKYYNSDDYISHSRVNSGLVNKLFHYARVYTMRHKKNIVSKYSSGSHVLDYGCGTGEFLNYIRKSSWSVSGVEPNANARKIALESFDLNIKDESFFEDIELASLDVITLWHVLEHVYPLHDRLKSFSEKLKTDGIIIAAVPNMKSLDVKIYGRHWAAWDVPRHIFHFDRKTIVSLFNQYNFELIAIRPMILDAFYISMLSEKYKSGSSKILRAMLNGVRSNASAFMRTGDYSSLIYIFKKSN